MFHGVVIRSYLNQSVCSHNSEASRWKTRWATEIYVPKNVFRRVLSVQNLWAVCHLLSHDYETRVAKYAIYNCQFWGQTVNFVAVKERRGTWFDLFDYVTCLILREEYKHQKLQSEVVLKKIFGLREIKWPSDEHDYIKRILLFRALHY
jgi:hypothetical protein